MSYIQEATDYEKGSSSISHGEYLSARDQAFNREELYADVGRLGAMVMLIGSVRFLAQQRILPAFVYGLIGAGIFNATNRRYQSIREGRQHPELPISNFIKF